jgi:hypothetical protein
MSDNSAEIPNNNNTNDNTNDNVDKIIASYVQKVKGEKQKMSDSMSKNAMVDLIFKQNALLAQQSSQMLDIVNMANNIENDAREDADKKCAIKLKNKCPLSNTGSVIDQQKLVIYENAARAHSVLLILLIIVLCWLIYHYSVNCS